MQESMTSGKGRRPAPLSEHSQTMRKRHPKACKAAVVRRSRSRFPRILCDQNSGRVVGSLNSGQSCPCQKQPCTRRTARFRGNTKSGRPGNLDTCRRKRRPAACRPRRNMSSGLVSRPRIRLILSWRCSRVRTSMSGNRLGHCIGDNKPKRHHDLC